VWNLHFTGNIRTCVTRIDIVRYKMCTTLKHCEQLQAFRQRGTFCEVLRSPLQQRRERRG
jgi:hypothetical protein